MNLVAVAALKKLSKSLGHQLSEDAVPVVQHILTQVAKAIFSEVPTSGRKVRTTISGLNKVVSITVIGHNGKFNEVRVKVAEDDYTKEYIYR